MPRRLDIVEDGGGRDCFNSTTCPVFKLLLTHLQRAPYTNVYENRLAQLEGRYPGLLHENRRSNNATLSCKVVNCPSHSQEKIPTPTIKVFHLKPEKTR